MDGRHIRWWAWRPKPFSFSIPLSNPHLLICLSLLPPPRLAAPQGRKEEGGREGGRPEWLLCDQTAPTERRTVALCVWTEGTKERAPMRAVAVGRRCESTFLHFSVRE